MFEQPGISTNVAAIQQGNVELEIVAVELATLRQGASGRADAKAQVPERLGDLGDHPSLSVFAESRVMQEKHVYIGTGKQCTSSVAAQSRDADPVPRARRKLIPELTDKGIGKIRALADGCLSVVRPLKPMAYLSRLDVIRILRYRTIRQRWHRFPVS